MKLCEKTSADDEELFAVSYFSSSTPSIRPRLSSPNRVHILEELGPLDRASMTSMSARSPADDLNDWRNEHELKIGRQWIHEESTAAKELRDRHPTTTLATIEQISHHQHTTPPCLPTYSQTFLSFTLRKRPRFRDCSSCGWPFRVLHRYRHCEALGTFCRFSCLRCCCRRLQHRPAVPGTMEFLADNRESFKHPTRLMQPCSSIVQSFYPPVLNQTAWITNTSLGAYDGIYQAPAPTSPVTRFLI